MRLWASLAGQPLSQGKLCFSHASPTSQPQTLWQEECACKMELGQIQIVQTALKVKILAWKNLRFTC